MFSYRLNLDILLYTDLKPIDNVGLIIIAAESNCHKGTAQLYVSSRGLTTRAIPHQGRIFELEFDFIEHRLDVRTSDGDSRTIALGDKSVAEMPIR